MRIEENDGLDFFRGLFSAFLVLGFLFGGAALIVWIMG